MKTGKARATAQRRRNLLSAVRDRLAQRPAAERRSDRAAPGPPEPERRR
jgi:hypothetical protein